MRTLSLLWFFMWRMTLLGFGLGALVGAAYGEAMLMSVIVPSILTGNTGSGDSGYALFVAFSTGLIYGLVGAVVGLALGTFCGLLLFGQARAFYHPVLNDFDRYRRTAGRACAAVGILTILTGWLIWLVYQAARYELSVSLGPFGFAVEATVLVVVPALLSAGAMWFLGRRVASQYTRKLVGSEAANHSSRAESMPGGWT